MRSTHLLSSSLPHFDAITSIYILYDAKGLWDILHNNKQNLSQTGVPQAFSCSCEPNRENIHKVLNSNLYFCHDNTSEVVIIQIHDCMCSVKPPLKVFLAF